jgi:hypothetical protein
VARIGTLVVADRNSHLGSGGAFLLKNASKVADKYTFPNGDGVEIGPGSPYAVARFDGTADPVSTFSRAFESIHLGLDGIAAQGKTNLEIHKAFEECLLWWREKDEQVLRVSSIASFSVTMTATLEVRDAQGNIKPPDPVPSPLVHKSLNHYRRSQTTDALFESFREMYLAFESLLSWRIPKARRERDVDWLKRALAMADAQIDLSNKCSQKWSDIANEFYRQIYSEVRVRIFHSKDSNLNLYPYRIADRELVENALERLGQIVIILYREWLNVRISTGGMTNAGFDLGTHWLNRSTEVLVSSSDLPLRTDETLDGPEFQNSDVFSSNLAVTESGPGLKVIVGAVEPTNLALHQLRRFGLKFEDKLIINHRLEADLVLDCVDSFEVAFGLRLRNTYPPKSYFLE